MPLYKSKHFLQTYQFKKRVNNGCKDEAENTMMTPANKLLLPLNKQTIINLYLMKSPKRNIWENKIKRRIFPRTILPQRYHQIGVQNISELCTLFPAASLPLPSSATWKRRFSRRMMEPAGGSAQALSTSAPTQSFRNVTSL